MPTKTGGGPAGEGAEEDEETAAEKSEIECFNSGNQRWLKKKLCGYQLG
jgi:hypothetical protein